MYNVKEGSKQCPSQNLITHLEQCNGTGPKMLFAASMLVSILNPAPCLCSGDSAGNQSSAPGSPTASYNHLGQAMSWRAVLKALFKL